MDDNEQRLGDVFAIPDLWRLSSFLDYTTAHKSFFFSQSRLDDIDATRQSNALEPPTKDDLFFSRPKLPFGITEDVQTPPLLVGPCHGTPPVLRPDIIHNEDIWILPDEKPSNVPAYQSWDGFENEKFVEPNTVYITEAGASLFDSALVASHDLLRIENTEHLMVDTRTYLSSVLALGLGRNSVFFYWDEGNQSFEPTLSNIRISGYSKEALDSALIPFTDCGKITKFLQKFVDKSYNRTHLPGQIALADAVSTLLATIQSRLSNCTFSQDSILQLHALFKPAHSILMSFQRIVSNVSTTRSDESMLSTMFHDIQLCEHRTDLHRDILLEILSRVSKPWLRFSSEWLGLQQEDSLPVAGEGNGNSFVKIESRDLFDDQDIQFYEPDFTLNYDKVPAFIAPEDARTMFEVGKSLRFLRVHHPDHPLTRAEVVASANPPTLEWNFSWGEILQLEAKALKYENDLRTMIRRFPASTPPTDVEHKLITTENSGKTQLDFFGRPEGDVQAHILASIDLFNQRPKTFKEMDPLSMSIRKYLIADDAPAEDERTLFAPPISLIPILSFNPIIAAQARLINGACMRMLFDRHKLREHLSLQKNFHLLGNGVFSCRLSHALFDPELESAETRQGTARAGGIMGLRLGGRETWPPASSELRLSLMGVLTESYELAGDAKMSRTGTFLDHNTLPGDLSFAVRDISEEEIEKCMNADSIEALDFLRLSYKPPKALEAVITPVILYKYDQIFRLLLRVLRMLYVVSALFRDATDRNSRWEEINTVAQRFRIEAHHFVSNVSGYFFDTGIESTWSVFDRKLDQVEQQITTDSETVRLGENEGLDKLREYHELVLDRIMFALLLRKRQQPVIKLLEEIFALILQFAKHSRQRALGLKRKSSDDDDDVRQIYIKFRKKVMVFIGVCRGLGEKKGYGDKRNMDAKEHGGLFDGNDLVNDNTISQLLVRLEMSNFYSRVVNM